AEAAIARGRKQSAQTAGGRPHARRAHAGGGVEKKGLRPVHRRELAAWFQASYGVGVQRACQLAQFSRAAWYRPSRRPDQAPLRLRIRELVAVSITGGSSSGLVRYALHPHTGELMPACFLNAFISRSFDSRRHDKNGEPEGDPH